MKGGFRVEKSKIQQMKETLLCQYSIFVLFLLTAPFLPATRFVTIIRLLVLMISSFILFFFKGKKRTTHSIFERYVLFLLQLVIFRKLGSHMSQCFGMNIHQLIHDWLSWYQLLCMIGYNLGITQRNKNSRTRTNVFAK